MRIRLLVILQIVVYLSKRKQNWISLLTLEFVLSFTLLSFFIIGFDYIKIKHLWLYVDYLCIDEMTFVIDDNSKSINFNSIIEVVMVWYLYFIILVHFVSEKTWPSVEYANFRYNQVTYHRLPRFTKWGDNKKFINNCNIVFPIKAHWNLKHSITISEMRFFSIIIFLYWSCCFFLSSFNFSCFASACCDKTDMLCLSHISAENVNSWSGRKSLAKILYFWTQCCMRQ